MKKTILIVDPQNDFIDGTLAVPCADQAMERLSQYLLKQKPDELERVVITMDTHPLNHSSFTPFGGPWPMHCVKYSQGAAIYPAVMSAIAHLANEKQVPIFFVEKGKLAEKEEYSAFQDSLPEFVQETKYLEVAGIAGEYCVLNTLKDIVKHHFCTDQMHILMNAIGSFDNGETVMQFAKENNIETLNI